MVQELEDNGYLVRRRLRNERGRLDRYYGALDNMGGAAYAADAERIRATMTENWDMVRGLFREALMLGNM